jgi:hypothetical protein
MPLNAFQNKSFQVFLCHEHAPLNSPIPENFEQKRGIKQISGSQVELLDGEILRDIDTIIYCTGYYYCFPFLKEV